MLYKYIVIDKKEAYITINVRLPSKLSKKYNKIVSKRYKW